MTSIGRAGWQLSQEWHTALPQDAPVGVRVIVNEGTLKLAIQGPGGLITRTLPAPRHWDSGPNRQGFTGVSLSPWPEGSICTIDAEIGPWAGELDTGISPIPNVKRGRLVDHSTLLVRNVEKVVVPANPRRRYLLIQSRAPYAVYLDFGRAVVEAQAGRLDAGAQLEFGSTFIPIDEVRAKFTQAVTAEEAPLMNLMIKEGE